MNFKWMPILDFLRQKPDVLAFFSADTESDLNAYKCVLPVSLMFVKYVFETVLQITPPYPEIDAHASGRPCG